jgi:hypothetical protein
VRALEEEVDKMAKELAQKDYQIKQASLQITGMKAQTDIDAESLLLLEHVWSLFLFYVFILGKNLR